MSNSNNAFAFKFIKEQLKSTLENYEKIILLKDQDITDETLHINMKEVEDKLTKKKEVDYKASGRRDYANKSELDEDEEFRQYNMFVPKINILGKKSNKASDVNNLLNSYASNYNLNKTNLDSESNMNNDNSTGNIISPLIKSNRNSNNFMLLNPNNEFLLLEEENKNLIINGSIQSSANNLNPKELNQYKKIENTCGLKQKTSFFNDYYMEYTYTDKATKEQQSIETKDIKKKNAQNSISVYTIANRDSNLLKHYRDLLKCDMTNKYGEFEDLKDEDLTYNIKEDDSEKKKRLSKIDNNAIENDFQARYSEACKEHKNTFSTVNLHINELIMKDNKIYKKFVNNPKDKNSTMYSKLRSLIKDKEKEKFEYKCDDVTFNINLSGVIEKKIGNTEKYHPRAIVINGPLLSWYRINNDENAVNVKKGEFDLRLNKITDNNLNSRNSDFMNKNNNGNNSKNLVTLNPYQTKFPNNNDTPKNQNNVVNYNYHSSSSSKIDDIFTVQNYTSPDKKEIQKLLHFKARKFDFLFNKSFKDIIDQIKKYYILIVNMLKSKIDCNRLRFLSDSSQEHFIPSTGDCNKLIIESIEWHRNLKRLSLINVDKTYLGVIFRNLCFSNCRLEELCLEATSNNTNVLEFDCNNSNIKNYFLSENSDNLSEFYLTNFKIENIENILELLLIQYKRRYNNLEELKKKYSNNLNNSSNNYNNAVNDIYDDNNNKVKANDPLLNSFKVSFPFKCLAFRKTSSVFGLNLKISLKELYNFFTEIVSYSGGIHNFWDCMRLLDLEGATVTDSNLFNKLITDVKLIKEINISNTKIFQLKNENNQFSHYQPEDYNKTDSINDYLINFPDLFNFSLDKRKASDTPVSIGRKKSLDSTCLESELVLTFLTTIYIYDTPISQEAFNSLMSLYKNCINFQNFYISEINSYVESIRLPYVLGEIKKFDDQFIENVMEVDFL